jgi:hypothetical protein
MRGTFSKAAATTVLGLVLIFSGESKAQTPLQSSKIQPVNPNLRYVDSEISYNLEPGRRTITIDCDTIPAFMDLQTRKPALLARIAFAAQFDILPDYKLLKKFNTMSKVEQNEALAIMNHETAGVLKSMLNMDEKTQDAFYRARTEMSLVTPDLKPFNKSQITHAIGFHGVAEEDFKKSALLCKAYYGLQ